MNIYIHEQVHDPAEDYIADEDPETPTTRRQAKEIDDLREECGRLRNALKSIVDIDYRGNRHESHDIAKRALAPNASFTQLRNKTP